MKAICFDMDGTIADLYGVKDWLQYLINENAYPYLIAKPLCNMKKLREVLLLLKDQGWNIRVISWLAKDSSPEYKRKVREATLRWLTYYNLPMDACHLVAYGTTKANCVRKYFNGQSMILIDDNEDVRDGWHLGDTIDPTSTDIVEALTSLLVY